MARTVTTGGAISGYCAIGSTRIAARPAMTMNTDNTAPKTGAPAAAPDKAASKPIEPAGKTADAKR